MGRRKPTSVLQQLKLGARKLTVLQVVILVAILIPLLPWPKELQEYKLKAAAYIYGGVAISAGWLAAMAVVYFPRPMRLPEVGAHYNRKVNAYNTYTERIAFSVAGLLLAALVSVGGYIVFGHWRVATIGVLVGFVVGIPFIIYARWKEG